MDLKIDTEADARMIRNAYRGLLRVATHVKTKEDKALVRKAFNVASEAHDGMRRKSNEPYILHPIAVARITAEEIRLGTTAVVAALLHDTVEDTYITLDYIEHQFGPKVKAIIDGLTKISDVFDQTSSLQAENFKKMLLTLSDDVRVILIKIADRLHNMRTLDSMRRDKQLKIASETIYMYAPLAHRLGLYSIKSELEDLSLKYTHPEAYAEIQDKLKRSQAVRNKFVNAFTEPIRADLDNLNLKYEIKSRAKSVYSIWNKINKKNIPFEEIYDLFAVRIVLDSPPDREKPDCWRAYSVVTDSYKPNLNRLRDWISTPKANGYESLHTTVMSDEGKWVEVQIRTRRMDEIAEMGYAAHWKYKDGKSGSGNLDNWIGKIRETLESNDEGALDFIDEFKLNLFSDEVFVFTPMGDLKTLPVGATALDFAFEIHSQVGETCIGAKVNQRLVPLSHELKSGDQIEIITSTKQKAKAGWLDYVVTAKAKSKIKSALKEADRKEAGIGKEMVQRKFKSLGVPFDSLNIAALERHFNYKDTVAMYRDIAHDRLSLKRLKDYVIVKDKLCFKGEEEVIPEDDGIAVGKVKKKYSHKDTLIIADGETDVPYKLSGCCNPIPGDDVFGFVSTHDGLKIHRMTCPNAVQLRSKHADRVLRATWQSQKDKEFLAEVNFKGIDDVGLVHRITETISSDLNVNMKSISFESNDGVFDGKITVYVYDVSHLNDLMNSLRNVEGVLKVRRGDMGDGQNPILH